MLPDSECIKIIAEILDKMDLGDYDIKLNHRGLLAGIFEMCGVGQDNMRAVCSSIDKLDKVTAFLKLELLNTIINYRSIYCRYLSADNLVKNYR
jgi:histidyl-tRNA synthetase